MRVLLAAGLLCLAVKSASAAIEVEVGRDGVTDDYLCWGLVEAKVRWTGQGSTPDKVKLRSKPLNAADRSGAVVFVDVAAPESRQDVPTVNLQPQEAWTRFLIGGFRASTADKDVAVAVEDEAGSLLATLPVMVRVRKNAERMTDAERDRFLSAFVNAAQRNNQFAKYWGLHTDAIRLAHQFAFLPWHRTLLIHLERELQLEDPSVALPYWEFDKPAPKLFSLDFLGRVDDAQPGPTIVNFSPSNPLSNWGLADPRATPLTRAVNGDVSVSTALNKNFMQLKEQIEMSFGMFGPYHGNAHTHIGGLVGDIRRSPADPLFFLLHANVDRAWAAWQRLYDRFNRDQPESYGLQGPRPNNPDAPALGNFEEDTMWPWDGIVRPTDPIIVTVGEIHLPPNPGPGDGLTNNPQVGEALDYLDLPNDGGNHGFCYDNIPPGVGPVPEFWIAP